MSMIAILQKFIALFLASFLLLGVKGTPEYHDVENPEECFLNFTVLSDVHMEGNNKEWRDRYIQVLYDVKNNKTANDALVFLGDNTMNGQHIENLFFYGITSLIHPADRIYTVMGNHDTGNGIGRYDKLSNRFWTYYNTFTGSNVTAPYYSYEIVKNCYFIFMNSESDAVNSPDISLEQIEWLDAVLTQADESGYPAFVFNHHPYTHLIENREELVDVLTKHSDVFYISGHTHTTHFTVYSFDEDSHFLNLPKCTDPNDAENPEDDTGLGIQVEVYDSQVIIRTRRYYTSEWVYEYNFAIT